MSEAIGVETAAGIATVTIRRPDMRNALDEEVLTGLTAALEAADEDGDTHAVVLTGEGSAFSAGGDIPTVVEWREADRERFETELGRYQAVVSQLRSMATPSVAAVNGAAVGAGCDLALACDVRVVAPSAELVEGFVTIGLVSGDGGAWLLPRLIGESMAKRYLLTGDPIDAEAAVEMGLAVAEDEDPVGRAREFAARLRDLPAAAVGRTKRLATTTPETLSDHFERATAAQWDCVHDEEHRETLDARLDGREPDLDR
jgi:2-(1,2-epoxy-1,2-dihydrophenyl)acetyl-CoA isomerase